jgi:hypothetical protein
MGRELDSDIAQRIVDAGKYSGHNGYLRGANDALILIHRYKDGISQDVFEKLDREIQENINKYGQ